MRLDQIEYNYPIIGIRDIYLWKRVSERYSYPYTYPYYDDYWWHRPWRPWW